MNVSFIVFSRTVENIVLAMCITRAAIYFDKWTLLWFLLLVLLNKSSIEVRQHGGKDNESADL